MIHNLLGLATVTLIFPEYTNSQYLSLGEKF